MKIQIIQPLVKLRRVVYGMIALGCAYLLSFFIYPTLLPESTQATAGVAVEPYLEISPSNSVAFSVNPGTFNSASQTLSVRTTNYTGYKLTLSANASADLVGSRGLSQQSLSQATRRQLHLPASRMVMVTASMRQIINLF